MSLDCKAIDAFMLVKCLCHEAGVCIHDLEESRLEIHQAVVDVVDGLRVKDEHGQWWRLRVQAERWPPA